MALAAELEALRERDEELRRIRELSEAVEQQVQAGLFEEMYDGWVNQEILRIQVARAEEIEKGNTPCQCYLEHTLSIYL